MLLKANTRWQEQAGDQHRDGLAISCGHAAQYMATIGAIYGSGSNVDLVVVKEKDNVQYLRGFDPANVKGVRTQK